MYNSSQGRLIVSLKGASLLDKERLIISHQHTAGIILFNHNFISNDLQSLQKLINDIQITAIEAGKVEGLPVFVDQEGGFVQRLTRGFSPLPPIETYGAIYDVNPETGLTLAYQYGYKLASELLKFGLISLCPVVDLKQGNKIIEGLGRAFHANPDACCQLAEAFIGGMMKAGMLATLKHFPGHGQGGIGDSHLMTPTDSRSLDELEQSALKPFLYLFGRKKIAAVMTAHILYPQVDPKHIASMSPIWINLLRDKYNYQGIIISDCLSMKGAGEDNNYLAKTEKALQLGDIALLSNLEPEVLLHVLDNLGQQYLMTTTVQKRFRTWIECTIKTRLGNLEKFPNQDKPLQQDLPNAETLQGSRVVCK